MPEAPVLTGFSPLNTSYCFPSHPTLSRDGRAMETSVPQSHGHEQERGERVAVANWGLHPQLTAGMTRSHATGTPEPPGIPGGDLPVADCTAATACKRPVTVAEPSGTVAGIQPVKQPWRLARELRICRRVNRRATATVMGSADSTWKPRHLARLRARRNQRSLGCGVCREARTSSNGRRLGFRWRVAESSP
jgi:hypothetical protein